MKSFFALLFGATAVTVAAQFSPAVFIQQTSPRNLRISWTNTAIGFGLERSRSLGPTAQWEAVMTVPTEQTGQFSVQINASNAEQFFRLRSLGLTRIAESSPLNGETGVAVTRETIVRFSAPLAKTAVLSGTNFFAGFGGRRLLTRIELSSDRTRASLFYLEPMPGSTRVTVVFDGAGLTDIWGRSVDADGDGVAGGVATMTFDTLNLTALAGTAVVGRVFASELMPGSDTVTNSVNRPLEGVTITVDGREQELRAVTDAQGKFTLSPAPPGRFFVKIDGRTAKGSQYPNGAYYPYVGKAWDAVATKTNNLAGGTGEIFLPLIGAGTLQAVSQTEDTTVSFPSSVITNNPALAGVFVTVPANSLFNDNGIRGGKVGIAPVAPDRLPGPLPQGADLPVVITVQTDGALNFDTPAPACFPNLPNSTTGKPWPPGTKGSLISFNHKKGVWEDVGGMTVSADGKFFCTDPGVGIRQPGWHGPQCPKPKKPKPKPDSTDCGQNKDTAAVADCFEVAREDAQKCRIMFLSAWADENGKCGESGATKGKKFEKACWRQAAKKFKGYEDICLRLEANEKAKCIDCFFGPLPGSSPALQNPRAFSATLSNSERAQVTDIETQIMATLTKIYDLVLPYTDPEVEFPDAVLAEIVGLSAQADTIAGGNASEFLANRLAELDRKDVARQNDLRFNRGDAPAYPVLFAAQIERPNESLTIRGETEPFGQYLAFVPPDGTLRNIDFYDPKTKTFGTTIASQQADAQYSIPRFALESLPSDAQDSDRDGLPDVVEFIYGTDPAKGDTDGDGVPDGAEVDAGTDPLGGLIARTGVIATVKTPGAAVDVSVGSDWVVTAEGSAGISIFNAYTGDNPVVIAHIPTPGTAQRVAVDGDFIAVAQPDFGVSIVNVSTPASPSMVQQFPLMGAQAVVLRGDTAYIGAGGVIMSIELSTGLVIPTRLTNTVRDLALDGGFLYALTDDRLLAFSVTDGSLALTASVSSPFFAKPNERLFVGGGLAYAIHTGGYNTFDLSVPSQPSLIKAGVTTLYGWKQMVSNGSGIGLAALGPNSAFDFAQDISLYDLSSPTNVNVPISIFPTPGQAQSVAIWKGLAYVADLEAGLQVINYLPYDSKGLAPTITLAPGFDTNGVAAGNRVFLAAHATDDVQVRSVEFYVDGDKVLTDGNFPFEGRFTVPVRSATKTNFTFQARAIDTGGNSAWSERIEATLLPATTDALPPFVTLTTPLGGGGRSLSNVIAYFSKPLDPATLSPASFQVVSAGPDGTLNTADDLAISGGVSYRDFGHAAILTFDAPLPLGNYRAVIRPSVTDLAGNPLAAPYSWDFQVADATFWVNFGDGPWDVASNWDTGVVPSATNSVVINYPVTVTLRNALTIGKTVSGVPGSKLYIPYSTSATFDGLTLDIDLLLDPSVGVRVNNGLTVNGVVTMPGGQNYTVFTFYGTQTLDGTGQILMTGPYPSFVQPLTGTLTVGPQLTIRGVGVVGNKAFPLVNLGTILAETPSTGPSMTVTGSAAENRGTLRSFPGAHLAANNLINHGVIDLPGGAFDLTGTTKSDDIGTLQGQGGTINIVGTLDNQNRDLQVDSVGPVWQLAGGTLLGGTVTTRNGAELVISYQGGILDGAKIDGDIRVVPSASLRVRNGLILNGTASVNTGANGVALNFDGSQTFGGTGQVRLILGNEFTLVRPLDGTLTIGPDLTIRGSGIIGNPSFPLVTQGTILAENGRTLRVFGSSVTNTGSLIANGGTLLTENVQNQRQISSTEGGSITLDKVWSNRGTIDLTNATLTLGGTFVTADIGAIHPKNSTVSIVGLLDNRDSTLTLDAPGWQLSAGKILGGTINGPTGVTLNATSRGNPTFATLDGVTLDIDLNLIASARVRITNGLTLNKTATLTGGPDGTTLNFDGTQVFGGSGEVIFTGFANTQVQPLNGSLTLAPGLTIRGGSATIGNKTNPLTIQAAIVADGPNSIIHLLGNPLATPGVRTELNGGTIVIDP